MRTPPTFYRKTLSESGEEEKASFVKEEPEVERRGEVDESGKKKEEELVTGQR